MDWQPIETAPKDGRFLVFGGKWVGEWSGDSDYATEVALVDRTYNAFDVADTEYYGPTIVAPTHWMPVPAPPAD
jgi:hypothetical protein